MIVESSLLIIVVASVLAALMIACSAARLAFRDNTARTTIIIDAKDGRLSQLVAGVGLALCWVALLARVIAVPGDFGDYDQLCLGAIAGWCWLAVPFAYFKEKVYILGFAVVGGVLAVMSWCLNGSAVEYLALVLGGVGFVGTVIGLAIGLAVAPMRWLKSHHKNKSLQLLVLVPVGVVMSVVSLAVALLEVAVGIKRWVVIAPFDYLSPPPYPFDLAIVAYQFWAIISGVVYLGGLYRLATLTALVMCGWVNVTKFPVVAMPIGSAMGVVALLTSGWWYKRQSAKLHPNNGNDSDNDEENIRLLY
jgi:hypothetical protein